MRACLDRFTFVMVIWTQPANRMQLYLSRLKHWYSQTRPPRQRLQDVSSTQLTWGTEILAWPEMLRKRHQADSFYASCGTDHWASP